MLELLQTLLLAIIAFALVARVWLESKRTATLRTEIADYLEHHAAKISEENSARMKGFLESLEEAVPDKAYMWLDDEGSTAGDHEDIDNIKVD